MQRFKRFGAISLLISLTLLLPWVAVSLAQERWETEADTRASAMIWKLAKKLPEVWRIRQEARRLKASLPEFAGEVKVPDSDLIYSWIADLAAFPHRRPGTEPGLAAEKWVAERMKELGLVNVTMDPVPITVWTAKEWSLTVAGEKIPSFFVVNTGFTPPQGITAPLVYVGEGEPRVFEKTPVKGKIVVAEVPFPYLPTGSLMKLTRSAYVLSDPKHELSLSSGQYLNFVRQNFIGGTTPDQSPPHDVYGQAYRRGAVGICLILKNQPSASNTHYGPYDGVMKPLPGLWIGKYEGEKLRRLAQAGAEATLVLVGETQAGVMHNVWGTLPGQSEEVILVTSHHDSPFHGAVEDAAGCAQVLAQAWAWSRVPLAQRPKSMVFVLDAGHFYGSLGAHTFARAHAELMKRVKVLLTLEHLGAKEVEEKNREYAETGRLALTVMFTSPRADLVAAIMKACERKPPRMMAAIPADFFGPAPTSDAAGYVLEAHVPVISWIGCPYYLLDAHDTLDKIEKSELKPIAETTTELVKTFMVMK